MPHNENRTPKERFGRQSLSTFYLTPFGILAYIYFAHFFAFTNPPQSKWENLKYVFLFFVVREKMNPAFSQRERERVRVFHSEAEQGGKVEGGPKGGGKDLWIKNGGFCSGRSGSVFGFWTTCMDDPELHDE